VLQYTVKVFFFMVRKKAKIGNPMLELFKKKIGEHLVNELKNATKLSVAF